MTSKSTLSQDISPMSLVLGMALELGALRHRVEMLEKSSTSSASPKGRAEWLLRQVERLMEFGPTLVHVLIWLTPKLVMVGGLVAAYLNGTLASVLRFLLAHL